MYLKKDKRPNGRTHLAICKSYRDPNTKRIRTKSILNIGYLQSLPNKWLKRKRKHKPLN